MNEKLFAATKKTFEKGASYPGYPTVRLTIADVSKNSNGTTILPDGEWTKNNTNLPTSAESDAFRTAGYETDNEGRPLHPWLTQMLANPDVGVITGKGFYHNWGPNYTADPIVLTHEVRTSVLLIKRSDTGIWALPGGFVDPGETNPADAARRELFEEADLKLELEGDLIYQDVVADLRTTAHAWAETSAYSFVVDERLPVAVTDPNEVKSVQWFYVDELPEQLHGSHAVLVQIALERLHNPQEHEGGHKKSIRDILNTPSNQLETTIVDAGHMAYDHLFVSDGTDRLFIKAHDASRFTDAFREAHSRAYLQKEFALFTQLAEEGYSAIPDRVDLVDDSLLAMDALHEDDGWQWRAPEDSQFDQYVRDVLTAFDQLQALPIPVNPSYHEVIEPTYETFWKEGWDDITDDKTEVLIEKIQQLSQDWSVQQQQFATQLIQDFPQLKKQAHALDRNVPLVMAHNDARQSNIGRHPDHGAKLVDWSWGDPAPKDADSTMFLIDLVKSGYDVSPYVDHINRDQVIVLIGFWLAHSLWQTRDGSSTVREQQVASASAAHRLLDLLT
ncbi:MAG TPA: NUDIX domain-containing protein [Candidatus Microsaccharimonas sp.]|jgi:ADP-ribose pyrophosphatase YjhB (NUDIX family)